MARLPDLEGLAIFAKVAECRSFTEAAAELRLSKATVSKAVSRIEARLGARLIVRTARSFDLTEAGRQLVGRAAHILSEATNGLLAQLPTTASQIALSQSDAVSFGLLPTTVRIGRCLIRSPRHQACLRPYHSVSQFWRLFDSPT